jgi:hypothetical protein
MPEYTYDLFISYKVHPEWNHWTRRYIYNKLKAYLHDEIGTAEIYLDDHTHTGADWVDQIGTALGRSKILLAVINTAYLSSQWCLHELDMMHSRLLDNKGCIMIFPILVNQGARRILPSEIERLQIYDLSEFRNSDLQQGTARFEKFSETLKHLSYDLSVAIQKAAPCDKAWEIACKKRFNDVYSAKQAGSRIPVETLTLKEPLRQTTVPRPTL